MSPTKEPANMTSKNAATKDKELALARLTEQQRQDLTRAKFAARWVGLILPLLLTVIGTVITASWVNRMPNPMAIHWSSDFQVDGYGPPWSNTALALGTGLLITSLYFMQSLSRMKPNAALWSASHRFVPAMVLGTVALMQIIAVTTSYIQLDVADANDATGTGWVLLAGFGAWIAITILAYLIQPKLVIAAPSSTVAEPLPLKPTERAVWFAEVRPSKPFLWFIVILFVIFFAATIAIFMSDIEPVAGWIMLASSMPILIVILTCLWFRVRIDSDGIEARSPLGWPVFKVSASDVKKVSSVHINPFAEYGGWGLRVGPNGFGIVMRDGEGILIERHSRGRNFAITVDDSATGAALLAAMADKAQDRTD